MHGGNENKHARTECSLLFIGEILGGTKGGTEIGKEKIASLRHKPVSVSISSSSSSVSIAPVSVTSVVSTKLRDIFQ